MGDSAPCRVAYINIGRLGGGECIALAIIDPEWADDETSALFGGGDDSPPEMVPFEPGLWVWEGHVLRGEAALAVSAGESEGGLWWVGMARRMTAAEAMAVAEGRNPLEAKA